MIKRTLPVILSMYLLLIPFFALAGAEPFCDEMPQGVRELEMELDPGVEFLDCLLVQGTSLGEYCLVLSPWGMNGYLLQDGHWKNYAQVSPMRQAGGSRLFFRRHRPGKAPDPQGSLGQAFTDDLGFDIIRRHIPFPQKDLELIQFHWLDGDFRLVGWQNPQTNQLAIWEDGQWVFCSSVSGERLGSVRIDRFYEGGLLASYEDLPDSLEAARKMEAITQVSAETLFPGWTLCSYQGFNGEHLAQAGYFRLENGSLTIRRVVLSSEKGVESQIDTMPVPLSDKLLARFQTEEAATLIDTSGGGDSFLTEDAFDLGQIPVSETVLQNDMQCHGLLLLTEDGSGARHIRFVEQEGSGYTVRTSQILPADASLDLFHSGDDEISLEWNSQRMQCAFGRTADGSWSLNWVMSGGGSGSETFGIRYCGITKVDSMNDLADISVGSHPWRDFFAADLTQLPTNAEAAANRLDRSGWAVVDNPDPAQRLHLRTEPDRSSPSLGKFYNCTPVQVLEHKGGWSRVRIGLDGHLEGWMQTQYLATGPAMDDVVTDLPDKSLWEEYENRPLFTSASMKETSGVLMRAYHWIVGVVEDKLYILLDADGNTGYLPQSWFWEGNG